MAEVIHRYVGRGGDVPERKQSESEIEREELDAEWRRKRIAAEDAKQKLAAAKLLALKGELISRQHVTKQAAFLVISLRQRLLTLSGELSRKIAESCEGDQRVIADLIDAGVRDALSEIAEMPLRVSDPRWVETLENEVTSSAKRPRRAAK